MPRGDKSKYTPKQIRKAENIVESYETKGVAHGEAESLAWATVNKQDGGGDKSGGGLTKAPREKRAARRNSARHAAEPKDGHAINKRRSSSS